MRDYRTDYSNHVHLLLVSVSKHLYILKNRTLKYQKKKMDFNLKNLKKADRELVVHYLIADHLSGVFYGEIHSSKKMIPVEEFLYRAWSKKENFPFCGLPTILSVPKTIESEELLNLVSSLGIEPINPTGGFMGGVVHLKIWEDRISQFEFFYNYQHKQPLAFEGLQTFNLKICVEESQQWLQRGNSRIGEKIELWKQGLKELILPPPQKEFFSLFKKKAEKKPKKYPPVKFEVFPTEDGKKLGEFVWGKERAKIEEKYVELLGYLHYGEVRGMLKTLQAMSKEDAEFIGTYELMGHLEYGKRNLKKAIEHFKKAVEVGDRIIPKGFNGHILNGVFENKYFLNSIHGLALCYLKTGDAAGALSCLDRMVKYSPGYYITLKVLIADAFLQESNFEKAKSIYSEDLLNPHSAYSMGLILFKEGKFEESIDILKAAFAKNPYIVRLLTGNMELDRRPSFGILLTDYGVACNYVEMNFRSWDAVDGALAFLKALFAHPLLNNDIQALSGILISLDRETDHQRKTQLEKSKSPLISRITSISSREIWKNLSE